MSTIRYLALENASGQRFPLNGTDGVYCSNLSGLGFTREPGFADLGRGFFQDVGSEFEPQQPVPVTITFTRAAYQTYQRFVDWLASAGSLKLVYKPFGSVEYYRDIFVESLQKGELNAVRWLECPCTFLALTPWYLPTPTSLTLESEGSENIKRYPYAYTEDLRYSSDSAAALSGTIFPSGHIPAALEIAYTGSITNPTIRLTGSVSGKTYGTCSVSVALEASDTLVFCTRYEESFVRKITAGGAVTDLLDFLDLSTEPFFHIPVDEPCTLSIESDSEITGAASVRVYYYFRSV